MGIVEAAAELFELLAAQDTTFTKHLLPGLSRDEIHALVSPLGITLPEEAIQFYEHYNLPKHYQYGPDQPTFYGIYWMLGLEDAVEEYKRRDFSGLRTAFAGVAGHNDWEKAEGWFPFLQEDAYLFVLDTFNAAEGVCPIIDLPEDCLPEPAFASLTAMFESFVEGIKNGTEEIEDGHIMM